MSEPIPDSLDSARLLVDIQQVSEIANGFSGCLIPESIAHQATTGLIEKFGCAMARIWLVEPDQSALRLMASAGLHTRIDGSFARIPMGAFKVGKIAKNRIAFLSNNLPAEPWVKDREWAITNNIQGFAGYPLAVGERVVGVIATFSHQTFTAEFLESLRFLGTLITVALDAALSQQPTPSNTIYPPLSEQIAQLFQPSALTLTGTEQPLAASLHCLLLRVAEVIRELDGKYCRLTYGADSVILAAILPTPNHQLSMVSDWIDSVLGNLRAAAACLGGSLQTPIGQNLQTIQVLLTIPYPSSPLGDKVYVDCLQPLLQEAFSQLAQAAGLIVTSIWNNHSPILTNNPSRLNSSAKIVWIHQGGQLLPQTIQACIDLSTTANQLRAAVTAVIRNTNWGLNQSSERKLSERELEMLHLLGQGLRDRDIAQQLTISESTVKFHLNNVMTKLNARTRYQALYQATVKGWICEPKKTN